MAQNINQDQIDQGGDQLTPIDQQQPAGVPPSETPVIPVPPVVLSPPIIIRPPEGDPIIIDVPTFTPPKPPIIVDNNPPIIEYVPAPPSEPSPPTQPPAPQTPIVGSPIVVETTTVPSVALSNFLQLSTQQIGRAYRKDSMDNIQSETLIIQNISQDLTLTVAFQSILGITFTPSQVSLPPQVGFPIQITFDTPTIQNLSEGISYITTMIGVTSDSSFVQTPQQRVVPNGVQTNPPTEPDAPIPIDGPSEPDDPIFKRLPIERPDSPSPFPTTPFFPPKKELPTWVNGLTGEIIIGRPPDGWYYDDSIGGWLPPIQDTPSFPPPIIPDSPPLEIPPVASDDPFPHNPDDGTLPSAPTPPIPSGGSGGGSGRNTDDIGDTTIDDTDINRIFEI